MSNRWRPFKLKFSAILLPTFWTNRIPRNIYVSLPILRFLLLYSDGARRPYEPPHDKNNKVAVRTAKTQISLDIRPVWSESSLYAHWAAKDPSFLHADSEGSDQTGRMPRQIWVFARRTVILLVLSRGGSFYLFIVDNCWKWQEIKGYDSLLVLCFAQLQPICFLK